MTGKTRDAIAVVMALVGLVLTVDTWRVLRVPRDLRAARRLEPWPDERLRLVSLS